MRTAREEILQYRVIEHYQLRYLVLFADSCGRDMLFDYVKSLVNDSRNMALSQHLSRAVLVSAALTTPGCHYPPPLPCWVLQLFSQTLAVSRL